MTRITRALFVVFAASQLLAGQAARAEPTDSAAVGQIVVTGSGKVTIPPTTGVFSITVTTFASRAAAAGEANARASKAVMDSLATSALAPGDIKGTELDVGPRWDYSGSESRRNGYSATNTIRIETDNLAGIGSVIDAALAAGATEVSDVSYRSKDIDAAREAALTRAVQAARAEAEVIARANGGTLGAMLLMNTKPGSMDEGFEQVIVAASRRASAPAAPRTSVRPSDIEVVREIEGRWRFVPGTPTAR